MILALGRLLKTLELWIYATLHFMHLLVDLVLNDGAEKMRCRALFFGLQYVLLFGCCHHSKFELKFHYIRMHFVPFVIFV